MLLIGLKGRPNLPPERALGRSRTAGTDVIFDKQASVREISQFASGENCRMLAEDHVQYRRAPVSGTGYENHFGFLHTMFTKLLVFGS